MRQQASQCPQCLTKQNRGELKQPKRTHKTMLYRPLAQQEPVTWFLCYSNDTTNPS